MTEILTESFCERCGTRYTFQTPAPRKGGMKRLKVLSRGLKNYVLSDESTLEEAFADARSDEERSISSEQLDAFHQTFNFCMSCRQYTCGNCWNGPENLCLTCAPDLSREILPAAFPDMDPMAGVAPLELPQVGIAHANEDRAALAAASAWPDADLARDDGTEPSEAFAAAVEIEGEAVAAIAPEAPEARETPEAIAALAAAAALAVPAGPDAPTIAEAASDEEAPVAEPLVEVPGSPVAPSEVPLEPRVAAPARPADERAAAAAAQTAALLARFRPNRDLDKALAEYEQAAEAAGPAVTAEPATAAAEPAEPAMAAAEPVAPAVAAAAEPAAAEPVAVEPVAAMEPPVAPAVAAAAAAEIVAPAPPEPAAPEPEPAALEPAAPTGPVSPERRDDRVEIPTWRIVAPDTTSTEPSASPPAITPSTSPSTPAWPPLASADPTDGSGPQWPAAAFLAAPASRARDALWAASSAELVEKAGGGVQSCVSCGLPLSATARFCRRCGTRQG